MRRLLITGAAGRIGSVLRAGLGDGQTILRLSDIRGLGKANAREEIVTADLGNLENALALCEGVDAVIHLAGLVSPTLKWDETLKNNILPNFNIFEAARLRGVRRVVFASSIHAHGFVRRSQVLSSETPYRPDGLYGLAKVFGEAAGRLYADKYGLEVVCLRIASFRPVPSSVRELGTWLSPRDAVQLVKRSVEAHDIHFLSVYGTSRNDVGLYDTSNWEVIGYAPEDDSREFADTVAKGPEADLERRFHGAHYVSAEFAGNIDRIS